MVFGMVLHRKLKFEGCRKTVQERGEMIQNSYNIRSTLSTVITVKILARSKAKVSVLSQKDNLKEKESKSRKKISQKEKERNSRIRKVLRLRAAYSNSATEPLPHSAACHDSAFLVILISSHPSAFDRRNAIRETWANVKQQDLFTHDRIRIVFLLGNSRDEQNDQLVKNETKTFGDIVHGSFKEAYRNATYKTLLGFKWAYFNCQQAKYIFKTDDDVFINLFALVKWLKSQPRIKLYAGYCWSRAKVKRDPTSKW